MKLLNVKRADVWEKNIEKDIDSKDKILRLIRAVELAAKLDSFVKVDIISIIYQNYVIAILINRSI